MRAAHQPQEPTLEAPRPSFEAVYRDHVGFVWRTLRRLGVAEAEIEDAAHEVFLVVHRRLAEFDGQAAITTWLFAIARGVASNRRRSAQRREQREEQAPGPAASPDPAEHLEQVRAAAAIERFLAGLPDEQRVVFELFEIEGMRGAEISEALALNINTVYTRLRAARQRFAQFLAEHHAREGRAHG
jgi:RNA polymerase sigma-70 factor (ECF subfamily)